MIKAISEDFTSVLVTGITHLRYIQGEDYWTTEDKISVLDFDADKFPTDVFASVSAELSAELSAEMSDELSAELSVEMSTTVSGQGLCFGGLPAGDANVEEPLC